jgi:gliding motility-associated-like protein
MKSYLNKAILFSLLLMSNSVQIFAQNGCVEIETISVAACKNAAQGEAEGYNEMMIFRVGPTPLNTSNLSVFWSPGGNDYVWPTPGLRQDGGTAQKVAALNSTIVACGYLVEPVNGVLPANKRVLLFTSYNISTVSNSFAQLSDTLIVIFQNAVNTGGHFLNYTAFQDFGYLQTTTVRFANSGTCQDQVTYDRNQLKKVDGSLGDEPGAFVSFTPSGEATYFNNGCQAPVPTYSADWSPPATICVTAAPLSLNPLITGTLGGTWSGPGVSGSQFSPTGLTGPISITYTVTPTINCAQQPTVTSTQVITVIDPSSIPLGFTNTGLGCPGGTLILVPDSIYAGATYTWTLPTGSTFVQNTLSIQNSNQSLNSGISLQIDFGGCIGPSFTLQNLVSDTIRPLILGDYHYCFEDSTVLKTQGGYISYTWSNGATSDSIFVGDGTYTVTAIDSNGCRCAASVSVTVTHSSPAADLTGLQRFCLGDSIPLMASEGPMDYPYVNYYWLQNADTLGKNQMYFHKGGDLILMVVDSKQCVDTVFISAPATNPPNGGFTVNPPGNAALVNTPFTFTNTSTAQQFDAIIGYNWYFTPPGDSATTVDANYTWFSPDTGPKQIMLVITSQLGCKDTVIFMLNIIDKPFVPNVFNPESEIAENSVFKIPFIEAYEGNTVVIFNRWGKKVYEATNYQNNWNGDNVPSGTYFYVVAAPSLEQPLKGSITLIRN